MEKIRPGERIQKIKQERLLGLRNAALLCIVLAWIVGTMNLVSGGPAIEFLTEVMAVLGSFAIVAAVVLDRWLRSLQE
jgi:hypothetical protein